MKKLDTGQDQLQRICDALRRETLEPALREAQQIEEEARLAARRLMEETQRACQEQEAALKASLERQRQLHEQNVRQSLQHALGVLRQEIQHSLFKRSFATALQAPMQETHLMARLLDALIGAIERDGLEADLEVTLGKAVSKDSLLDALRPAIREALDGQTFATGLFQGGVTLSLKGPDITVDMSDQAVRELLARFLQKDLRHFLFG